MIEHIHFNRITQIIENKDNTVKHLKAIRTILKTYQDRFGTTTLYTRLLTKQTLLILSI